MNERQLTNGALNQLIKQQQEWIKQHGGSRYGYIRVYAPTTSTEEALAIYKADRDYLIRLETEYNRRRTTN